MLVFESNYTGPKFEAVDFPPVGKGIRIPAEVRVLGMGTDAFAVPGPNGTTRLFVHPNDVAKIKEANETSHLVAGSGPPSGPY